METNPPPAAARRRKTRGQFFLAGLLTLLLLAWFFQPAATSWWLRRSLTARAENAGCRVAFGKVEGDFFAGEAVLRDIRLDAREQPANRVRCAVLEIDFSPWRTLFQPDLSPVQQVTIGKTQVDWQWQSQTSAGRGLQKVRTWHNRFPEALSGTDISANLRCGLAKVEMTRADFSFTPDEAGTINIPRLQVSLAPWRRIFNKLEGVTAIKERALYVGGLKFTPDLILERGTLDFTVPSRQKITSELLFSAFGGQWRTDIDLVRRKTPVEIDTASSFWNLSVQQMGDFLGNEELAEGVIHEGRLTFHGNPGQPEKANTTLRLNATDFRWHERRWNSLIASGLLMNRRIEIAQFDLIQEKNQIQLKGTSDMPGKWLQLPAEFQIQVLAQIDDLRSAALLVFPGQKKIGGEAFFAGEVRNRKGQFSGNLKMRGGPLQINQVSVDRMRGDLDLQGSEMSFTNLDFARQNDKAAGWATLNLAEPHRYSGELEVTAQNIADFSELLPRAVAERAVAGGVKLWWSGDGTRHAHSGAYKLSLDDFLISRETSAVPLDVESDGSYSPGGITMNHLVLSRPATTLKAAIAIRPDSLEVRDLQVNGSGGSSLAGHLTLPVNLFAALDNPTLAALLDSKASFATRLAGNKVRLDELAELSGRHFPFRGRADFNLVADGRLESLEAKCGLALSDFFASESLSIPAMKANATLAQNELSINADINPDEGRDRFAAALKFGSQLSKDHLLTGKWIDEQKPLAGNVKANRLAVSYLHRWLPPLRAFQGDAGGDLTISGTWAAPALEGQIALQNTEWQPGWLHYPLQKLNGTLLVAKDQLSSEKILGSYRGGTFSVSGTASTDLSQALDLTITGRKLPFFSTLDSSGGVADVSLFLQGPAADRLISGQIVLKNAVLHQELTVVTPAIDLPVISRFSLPWLPPAWRIDLEVTAEQPVEIRGKLQTWLARPEMVFRNVAGHPLILGKLLFQPRTFATEGVSEKDRLQAYFMDSTLEEGVVETVQPAFATDLPPAPALQPATVPAAEPPPAGPPRRLEMMPAGS